MAYVDYAPQTFLIVHEPLSGEPRIVDSALKVAIAAAQLAHLLVNRHLQIVEDGSIAISRPGNGSHQVYNPVDAQIIEALEGSRPRPLPAVLATIGPSAYDTVAAELVRDGTVRDNPARQPRRRGAGAKPRAFPAADALTASLPHHRLNDVIRSPRRATLADAFKIALLLALDAHHLLEEMSPAFRRELHTELPSQLRLLLTEVEHAT